jgi:hypothetical protein
MNRTPRPRPNGLGHDSPGATGATAHTGKESPMLSAICLILAPPLLAYGICAAFAVPRRSQPAPAELVRYGQGRKTKKPRPNSFESQRSGGRSTPREE